MIHEELLAKIQVFLVATELQSIDENFEGTKMLKALRSVVELHKPTGWFEDTGYADQECVYCDNGSYPCPTIQAIEKELG